MENLKKKSIFTALCTGLLLFAGQALGSEDAEEQRQYEEEIETWNQSSTEANPNIVQKLRDSIGTLVAHDMKWYPELYGSLHFLSTLKSTDEAKWGGIIDSVRGLKDEIFTKFESVFIKQGAALGYRYNCYPRQWFDKKFDASLKIITHWQPVSCSKAKRFAELYQRDYDELLRQLGVQEEVNFEDYIANRSEQQSEQPIGDESLTSKIERSFGIASASRGAIKLALFGIPIKQNRHVIQRDAEALVYYNEDGVAFRIVSGKSSQLGTPMTDAQVSRIGYIEMGPDEVEELRRDTRQRIKTQELVDCTVSATSGLDIDSLGATEPELFYYATKHVQQLSRKYFEIMFRREDDQTENDEDNQQRRKIQQNDSPLLDVYQNRGICSGSAGSCSGKTGIDFPGPFFMNSKKNQWNLCHEVSHTYLLHDSSTPYDQREYEAQNKTGQTLYTLENMDVIYDVCSMWLEKFITSNMKWDPYTYGVLNFLSKLRKIDPFLYRCIFQKLKRTKNLLQPELARNRYMFDEWIENFALPVIENWQPVPWNRAQEIARLCNTCPRLALEQLRSAQEETEGDE
ncbi:hypothetical protein ACFLX2_00130 [Candidatus Dependentiae bacterium]